MFLIAPDGGKDALSLRMPWLVVIADLHLHVFFCLFFFKKQKTEIPVLQNNSVCEAGA